jgi:hypothetical protein
MHTHRQAGKERRRRKKNEMDEMKIYNQFIHDEIVENMK